jgi:serine protease AprX
MPEELRLPIKVVIPAAADFQVPRAGGGARKKFGDVTPEIRSALAGEVNSIGEHFFGGVARGTILPVVAKVILKQKALAKSHRPSALFSQSTCPIIGGRDFGEILISVRQDGLNRLLQKLRQDDTATGIADMSTINRIVPFLPEDAMKMSAQGNDTLRRAGKVDLKFRLFRHLMRDLDDIIYQAFQELLGQMRLRSEELEYGEGERIFRVKDAPERAVAALASFVGTQSLSDFPLYRAVRTEAIPLREAQIADFPAPQAGENYPVVGLIDSGVNPNDPLLRPWMAGREIFVPAEYRDHHHGSFVAALVVNGRRLNHDDPRFPEARAKFVDVVAIPGSGQGSDRRLPCACGPTELAS